MKLADLLDDIPQEWHHAFVRFVETGEAEAAFLDYLDRDKRGQRAIERAFSAQAEALEGLGAALRESGRAQQGTAATTRSVERRDTSIAIANAFEQVLELSTEDRRSTLADAAAAMARAADGGRVKKLRTAVSDFQRAVEKTAG